MIPESKLFQIVGRRYRTILHHVLLHRAPREEFVRSFEKRDKGTTGETKRRIQEKFEISVSLSYARTGTHLLLVNSSPGKEGRRVCWERGLEKKRGIRPPFFVQHLNNSLRHAVYANLLRR